MLHKTSLFISWLTAKGLSDRTVVEYHRYLNKFIQFLDGQIINQQAISQFLSLKGSMNKPCRAFIVNYLEFIRDHYSSLGLTNQEAIDIGNIRIPKLTGRVKVRKVNYVSDIYIPLIATNMKTLMSRNQMLIMALCGLRHDESCRVKEEDIDFKNSEIRVIGKGDKERIIPIPLSFLEQLKVYIKNNKQNFYKGTYMFLHKDTRKALKTIKGDFSKELEIAGIRSGFTKLDSNGNIIQNTKVNPHKLRHSYATSLRRDGFELDEIKELLGHSDISTTQIYAHIDNSKLKSKVQESFKNRSLF